ncbi:MAG: hypothetical protein ING40_05525 [Burkholderiales bacterium]|jgi:hypothetical protein|nr:hypothetical protein [Burkholderiales bacterium]MCA3228480.1 hypothetical protein [Burkholderiales bacterium]
MKRFLVSMIAALFIRELVWIVFDLPRGQPLLSLWGTVELFAYLLLAGGLWLYLDRRSSPSR